MRLPDPEPLPVLVRGKREVEAGEDVAVDGRAALAVVDATAETEQAAHFVGDDGNGSPDVATFGSAIAATRAVDRAEKRGCRARPSSDEGATMVSTYGIVRLQNMGASCRLGFVDGEAQPSRVARVPM